KIVDAILGLRTEAVRNGIMLPEHRKVAQLVISKGHAVPINDNSKAQRLQLGLDELPANVHKFPEALEQVKKLLESTGFVELIAEEDSK
ncbi:MAG: CoB--CoM heterodisulfide reductase subunit C, partial [ANME-2 cluster archaeon]|nr:CoB--CoM heterodisulfide reductase subunit C [ANME-2 cluster archaeon]